MTLICQTLMGAKAMLGIFSIVREGERTEMATKG